MDINPLFKLFQGYAHYVKKHHPSSSIYLHITSTGTGYTTIVENGEHLVTNAWDSYSGGLHTLRTAISKEKT